MNLTDIITHINTTLILFFSSAVVFALSALPVLAFTHPVGGTPGGGGGGGTPGGGGGGNTSLQNPLSVNSISELLLAILNIIVIIMIPIVIFFIVYAGFLFVTAQGNAEQIENAKRALLYALIGGVLIIGAEAITAIIEQVVADFQA